MSKGSLLTYKFTNKELNVLYNSKSPNDVVSFYDTVGGTEDLLNFMVWRKKQSCDYKIYEINAGGGNNIVIIPTANFRKVKDRLTKIYKGLHIIFIESKGMYFNYARAINTAFKYMKSTYNPKFCIVSNDDINSVDWNGGIEKNITKRMAVYIPHRIKNGKRYNDVTALYHPSIITDIYYILKDRHILETNRRFGIKILNMVESGMPIAVRISDFYIPVGDFFILDMELFKNRNIFDDKFINGFEDVYFSYKHKVTATNRINLFVDSKEGATLGMGHARDLRQIVNLRYLQSIISV